MALEDLSSVLGVPENYASPQQLAMARQLAQALMKPQQGPMQSWTQPASQIVNALIGAKYMQQANASDRANAGAGLPGPSLTGQPGPGPLSSPGQQTSVGGSDPASIRYNNPGAQWPGPSASNYGSTGYGVIGGGNKIAQFPDAESGAAAQFDLLARNYTGMRLSDAVHKWSGGNSSREYTAAISKATGLPPDSPLTPQMLADPAVAVPLAKAMAQVETGRPYPLTDEQWQQAHARVFGGTTQVADASNSTVPSAGPPQNPAGAPSQAMVSPTGQGPQPTPGASASPQGAPGAGPPPQLMHQQLITPQMIAQLRYTGNTAMADKLYEMYLQQQQPQTIEWGGVKYMYPGGHPEQAMAVPGAPQAHPFEVGKIKGSDYQRLTPQGFENVPQLPSGGTPPAPQTAGAPASGGYPSQMPSDLSGRIQLEQNMEKQGKQNEADVKEYSSKFNALVGLGADAKDQLPYIQIGKSIVNDPGFYSGTSESSVLGLKRLAVAAGLTNATGATPQEAFRKVMSTMILNQIRTMKESQAAEGGGTQGRIFQQQIQLMEKAAANPDNSPAANRYLLNLFEWSANRNLATANMALDYKMQKGGLDPGFDKMLLNSQDERLNAPESLLFSPEGEGGAPASRGPLESKAALGGPSTSKFQEGQTATNPTTGERRIFKGGKWQTM